MPEYLVELYVAQGDSHPELPGVHCLQAIAVPTDETCFLLVEAPSADLVEEAVRRAGLTHAHVTEAASSGGPHYGRNTMSTTTPDVATDLTELRDKQQKVWSSGDYNRIAAITVPLSESLIDHVGVSPSTRLLDVATGTGHAALAAARRMASVTGIDYVPALLDIAGRRAAAEDLAVEFLEADAENLPFADGSFDAVVSAIGVMFSADHARAAQELVRVCAPGGRIALANWTPEGFVGGMLATVGKHVSPPPGAQPPTRWGVEATLVELLGDEVRDLESFTRTVTQRFDSAEQFADLFLEYYGPTYSAANRLDEAGRAALREDLIDLAKRFDRGTDGTVVCDWEYRIVLAVRR